MPVPTTDRTDIGRIGLWSADLDRHPTTRVRDLVQEIEGQGWPTLWRPESNARDALVSAAIMLDATTTLNVATGIAMIQARHPHTTRAAQLTLHEASNGRFLLGLGVSHARHVVGSRKLEYRTPYSDMVEYLGAMTEAPFTGLAAPTEPATVLAALGPKMLKLAATAADGAHPYFVPVEHTAMAREVLGEGPLLAPEQMVVIDTDRDRARDVARLHMQRYLELPNYVNNLFRQGFTEDDVNTMSNKLVDAIVVCGSIDDVVTRVGAHHAAGADHVCIQVLEATREEPPVATWQALAEALAV